MTDQLDMPEALRKIMDLPECDGKGLSDDYLAELLASFPPHKEVSHDSK